MQLIISDDHGGLRAGRQAVFGGTPWQRCQFHLQQNARAYVPRKDMQAEVAERIREVFNASSGAMAKQQLKALVSEMAGHAPRLAAWLKKNLPEGCRVFAFPKPHWRKLRTGNVVKRLHWEIRGRARVVGIFPNQAACLRLMSAALMKQDKAWETGRLYLRFKGAAESITVPSGRQTPKKFVAFEDTTVLPFLQKKLDTIQPTLKLREREAAYA